MEKTLKESFSVFGKTTLRKFSKLKIYVEGLSKVQWFLNNRLEQIWLPIWSCSTPTTLLFMTHSSSDLKIATILSVLLLLYEIDYSK